MLWPQLYRYVRSILSPLSQSRRGFLPISQPQTVSHQTLGSDDLTFPTKSLTYLWDFSWHSSKGSLLLVPWFLLTHLYDLAGVVVYPLFVLPTFPHFYRLNVARVLPLCCSWGKLSFSFLSCKLTLFSLPYCLLNQHIEFRHLWDPLQVDRLLIQLKLK